MAGHETPVCPTLNLMRVIGKKWTIPIMEEIYFSDGKASFNAIQDSLSGITPRMLSKSLDELRSYYLLSRSESNFGNVLHIQYELTDKGKRVADLIRDIKALGRCFYMYETNASCKDIKCSACGLLERAKEKREGAFFTEIL